MDWTVLFVDCMAFNGKQISKKLRHAAYEISAYLLNFKMILREKCLNTEFFSGLYFPAFGLITERYVFSPNAGKYGPEKTPYLDTFQAL